MSTCRIPLLGAFLYLATAAPRTVLGEAPVQSAPVLVPSGDFQVNEIWAYDQYAPVVAAAPDGRFVVAWVSYNDDALTGIAGRRFGKSGTPLGGEFLVNTTTDDGQFAPSVAMAPDASFVVAWDSYITGPAARRFDANGLPMGDDFPLASPDQEVCLPRVRTNPSGGFVLLVRECDFPHRLFSRALSSEGILGPLLHSLEVGSPTSVRVTPDGHLLIAWTTVEYEVLVRRFDTSGLPMGDQVRIDVTRSLSWPVADLAIAPTGNAMVVWGRETSTATGRRWQLVGRPIDVSGAPAGDEFVVTQDIQGGGVVADRDGDFLITWSRVSVDAAARASVQGAFVDREGLPLSPIVRVSSPSEEDQWGPRTATLGDDSFVVVWTDDGYEAPRDGSGSGIVATTLGSGNTPLVCGIEPRPYCAGARTTSRATLALGQVVRFSSRRTLRWQSKMREGNAPTEIGDPLGRDDVIVCLYDGDSALLLQSLLPSAGTCGRLPCWRRTRRGDVRYAGRGTNGDGAVRLVLSPRGRHGVRGSAVLRGETLPSLDPPPQFPITFQVLSETGACWGTRFEASDIRRQSTSKIVARTPRSR